jgi:tetratricopeptide (TPR) repeat protein
MRTQLFAVSLAFCAGVAAPAHAQYWGLQAPGRALSGTGIVEYQSRDWVQCTGEEQVPPPRAISACGRVISERFSRDATATALYYRSLLYRQTGEPARADADVSRAIELLVALIEAEPDNPEHLNNLIFLRTDTRDFVGAAQDYERIADRQPRAIEPRLYQAGFYFRAGDYPSAATAFDSAAQLDPTNAQAQAGRCEARAAGNIQLDVAQQACAESLRLSNQSAPALFSRGFLNFRQGQMEAAWADFRAAGEKDNTNSFAAYGYAVTSLRLGRHEENARELLTNVTAAVPDVEMYARAGMAP